MKSNNLWLLEIHLMCAFLFRVELFSRYTKVASEMCSSMLNGCCQTYAFHKMFLSLCGFIVFGPYILQNPLGKTNNFTLVPNAFLHEKQGITWNTSLKASIESGNLRSQDKQSIKTSSIIPALHLQTRWITFVVEWRLLLLIIVTFYYTN